jgi:uncharacterized protein (DUF433 family)
MTVVRSPSFPDIVRDDALLEGEPVVRGTRVPVRTIAILCRLYHTMDALLAAYPMLSPEAINQALAYYGVHWEEIERYIAENENGEPD